MKGYRTKRIALPGGRVIEIVYFSEPGEGGADGDDAAPREQVPAPAEAATAAAAAEQPPPPVEPRAEPAVLEADELGLHVCPSCESDLVYPVAWEERDHDSWNIERRCPNCEWRHVGDFCQEEVEFFDDALNDGTEDLLVALRNLARANMEDDVERLIAAIHADLIEPMDF